MAPLLATWLGKPQPDGALFSTEQAVHPRLLQGYLKMVNEAHANSLLKSVSARSDTVMPVGLPAGGVKLPGPEDCAIISEACTCLQAQLYCFYSLIN